MRVALAVLALQLVLFLAAPVSAQPGWSRYDLSTTYALRYIPTGLDTTGPVPIAIFFHGSGGTPEAYQSFVAGPADEAGLVLLLPKSMDMAGWGGTDVAPVNELLDRVAMDLTVDDSRTSLAGHSAGAAFAYILTYMSEGINAVFTLAAPAYPIDAVADARYTAPIRMYYGTDDPNYTGGSYMRLVSQWDGLGVTHEDDIQMGFGHSTWPTSSMTEGFRFLVGHRYPVMGGADAGVPAVDGGGGGLDAGTMGRSDGGPGADSGPLLRIDAGGRPGGRGSSGGGCGCEIPGSGAARGAALWWSALACMLLLRRRG